VFKVTKNTIKSYISSNIEGKKPSKSTLFTHRSGLQNSDSFDSIKDQQNICFNNAVVFICDRPNFFFLRFSIALRKKNVSTFLITRWGVDSNHKEYFDNVILYDIFSDLEIISEWSPKLIYVQSWIGWNFLPCYIYFIAKCEVICNTNDLTSILFDDLSDLKLLGLSENDIEIDVACERFIFNKFKLVTCPYVESAVFRAKDYFLLKKNTNVITFPCYPSEEFFFNKSQLSHDRISLVYLGGIPADDKPDDLFADAKMQIVSNDILRMNFNLSILGNPQSKVGTHMNEYSNKYEYLSLLSKNYNNFIFDTGVFPWHFRTGINNYSFALLLVRVDKTTMSRFHNGTILASKMFTYIELSLPIIVYEECTEASKFVKKHGIGISISISETDRLYEIIKGRISEYDKFLYNIYKYRKNNSMEVMVDNLNDKNNNLFYGGRK